MTRRGSAVHETQGLPLDYVRKYRTGTIVVKKKDNNTYILNRYHSTTELQDCKEEMSEERLLCRPEERSFRRLQKINVEIVPAALQTIGIVTKIFRKFHKNDSVKHGFHETGSQNN